MNRQKADKALAIAFTLFVTAVAVRWFYREAVWSQALFRMAEAALVGGVADWFAVTALFQRPLGVAFHTAIIPRNREKIVRAMSYMVQEEFLSRQSIQRHLQKIRLVSLLINWMESGGKQVVFRLLTRGLAAWLRNADRSRLVSTLAKATQNRLLAIKFHCYAPVLGRWLIHSGKADFFFDLVLTEAKQVAARPSLRQEIYRFLDNATHQATGESTLGRLFGSFLRTFDFINLDEAADALYQRLLSELEALEQTHHPLRVWLNERLVQSLNELEHNPEWQQALEQWKTGLVDRIPLEDILRPLVDGLLGSATDQNLDSFDESHTLIAGVLRFADRYWVALRQDTALQDWLERHLQEAAAEVVLSEHSLIGELVGQAMGTLSDEELNVFIEDKVGEDLAWIRINGSVVGALAGLVVFFVGQYVYLPYIWPLLVGGR
ncbi:MAG: hypothetical protein K0Q77_1999 [Anaerosporomusa subterranea]|nr:hypothetical protein [Anaerosporomusa subterranea]